MLKRIFLILSVGLGCSSCGAYPVKYKYVLDVPHMVCTRWEIDPVSLNEVSGTGANLPIMSCNGFVSESPHDYVNEKHFILDNCPLKTNDQ